MKKIVALVLSMLMVLSLCACGEAKSDKMKVGFIFLHDENSTYDLNFINAAKEACDKLGVEAVFKTNIDESDACYNAAAELVDEGCKIVFADSFGHEDYMIKAAREFTNVQFCHATGTKAHTENRSNFHNAFASIYEGRYLAGVAAGLKLQEMINAGTVSADAVKIGYIGAYTYAEVISGYTSFFLGVQSIVPQTTMEVTFTGSWYDETAEKEAAQKLINNGCVLISQHADSMGAPTACENAGVPNVSYNGSTATACPNTFVVSSRINWAPYFELIINAVQNGSSIPTDYTGSLEDGSVVLTALGSAAAAGTDAKLAEVEAALKAGTLQVFDTAKFTVGGEHLTTYMADVDTDEAYTGDHEVIVNGAFIESGDGFRSAPYFSLQIDGINLLDQVY